MPELPGDDVIFDEAERKVLVIQGSVNPIAPQEPPPLRETVRTLGKLGGFLAARAMASPALRRSGAD